MSDPAIIAVAITGSVPRKSDNPAVPISITEQIESTHEAYEAGATLVHVHMRNADETTSSDSEKFGAFQEGIRRHCPDIIVQFSTGGRGRALEERGAMLHLRPDMASLATGSCNFPTIVYENPPAFVRGLATQMRDLGVRPEIEVFDLAMLYNAADLVAEGADPAGAARAVRDGREARASRAARHPRVRGGEAARASARRHLHRRRDRPAPDGGRALVARPRRPRPHRARGQHPPRPLDARPLERRPGAPRRGALRPAPPPRCHRCTGAPAFGASGAGVAPQWSPDLKNRARLRPCSEAGWRATPTGSGPSATRERERCRPLPSST